MFDNCLTELNDYDLLQCSNTVYGFHIGHSKCLNTVVILSSAVNKEWHSHVAEEGYKNEANIKQCGPKY